MDTGEEIWAKCQRCGTELKQGDKECPKCGFTKKHFIRTSQVVVELKATVGKEHVARWSSKTYAILFGILAVILFLLYLVYEVLPLAPWLNVVVVVVLLMVLVVIGYWQRYVLLMFIRWLDRKLTARKTTGIK